MRTRHPQSIARADVKDEVDELTQRIKDLQLDLGDLAAEEEDERLAVELRQMVEELEAELAQRKQQQKKD